MLAAVVSSRGQSRISPTALCVTLKGSELLTDGNMLAKAELYAEPGHT